MNDVMYFITQPWLMRQFGIFHMNLESPPDTRRHKLLIKMMRSSEIDVVLWLMSA